VESLCRKEFNHQANRPIQFETGSLETLKNIIDHRLGFTLLPQLATLGWKTADKQRLRRFKGKKPVREVSLVFHKSFSKEGLIKALQKEIIANLPTGFRGNANGKIIDWVQKQPGVN
jgi:LysR family hydrogen peroxide-inducible transcriptional activator